MIPTGLTYPFLKNKPTKKKKLISNLVKVFAVKLSFLYFLPFSVRKEKQKKGVRKFSEAHLKFYVSIHFSWKNSKD